MSHYIVRFGGISRKSVVLLALLGTGCATAPDSHWPPPPRMAQAPTASCFAEAASDPNLEAIVHIVVAQHEGAVLSRGTGFIVRNSQGADGHQRVLTASHVVAPALEAPGRVAVHVTLANGQVIGQAQIVATARPWSAATRDDASVRDLAVLRVSPADAAAAHRWRAIDGLPLAARQRDDSILRGRVTQPAGPDVGASGSPVLDPAGRVVGVLTKVQALDPLGVSIAAADIGARISGGADAPAILPRGSTVIADPVSAGSVLAALGRAGAGIETAPGGARLAEAPIVTAGFPRRLCIRFQGAMAEAPLPPDAASVARLRSAFAAASM